MNKYESKLIRPELTKGIINEDDDTLALVAVCTGKSVARGRAPFIGKYVRVGTNLVTEHNPNVEHLEFAYEWVESGPDAGTLIRIYVGTALHGPLLSWDRDGWRNCYGHGDHGNNGACGGTWSSSTKAVYPTLAEALQHRDYFVGDVSMIRSALTEGPLLLKALHIASCVEEITH